MKKKDERLHLIRELIKKYNISKQEDLLSKLSERGFDIAQATLSRDLKEINAAIKHDKEYGSIYFIPENKNTDNFNEIKLVDVVRSIEFTKNFVVMKVVSGFANSVAAIIDSKNVEELMGTIAGDDTLLLILRDENSQDKIIDKLELLFPKIRYLIV